MQGSKSFITSAGVAFLLLCFYDGVASRNTSDPDEFISAEQRLLDTLLKDRQYNKHLKPGRNDSDTTKVRFGIALIEIIDMDDVKQFLDILIWMRQLWNDFRLKWEPSEFDGIASIRIPSDQVWLPDVVSYNHPRDDWYITSNVVVYNTGDVLFIPPGETRMKCAVDLTYFPGDDQNCFAKFGSWTHDGFAIELDFYEGKKEIDLSDFSRHNEFEITTNEAKLNTKYYPCCSEPYPDITYKLGLRRRSSGMYFSLLLTPGLLIALLSPLMFILPSGDPHRFNFGGALLICLAVLMTLLNESLPPHPSPPLISSYFSGLFVIVSVSLALSAITTNIDNRSTRLQPMPAILKRFMSCMARPLLVNMDQGYDDVDGHQQTGDKEAVMAARRMRGDWHILATILDRTFFIIFLLLSIILTLAILPQIVKF